MSDELVKRVASRWRAAVQDDEDEPHDPSNGVLDKWQYDSLTDKKAWKGYLYSASQWTWDAAHYEDQDEPDSWGDSTKHGPLMTLDEVLTALDKLPVKWSEWIAIEEHGGQFQSTVKKTKKAVTQMIASIERADGKRLSYDERQHIGRQLKLKR